MIVSESFLKIERGFFHVLKSRYCLSLYALKWKFDFVMKKAAN